ncbi:MAG: Na(+)/H(+) antiporter subunit D [Gammaproteobacteria bacterium]|jgi:multicomponent Na+:H+ antiporter subunit D|nr:Na(+)/H(+) antiporter subunit D [Gammaproteobacteria bacterium]
MSASLPPFAIFFAGALLLVLLHGRLQKTLLLLVPLLSVALLLGVPEGLVVKVQLLGYELVPYRTDRLSLLFAYVFNLAAFIGIVFSLHVQDRIQHVATLVYAGSALGAVLAGDLISVFVYWELAAVSSVFLIWARRSPRAVAAGWRYLVFQFLSGLLLLAGILMRFHETGSLAFDYIGLDDVSGWLLFTAFGIKCAFPLLHNWLTDAYPEATPSGTVFLSAFTTKAAVYMLARGFPGTEILIYIGAIMTCFPIFYAVIENDLRRVLAYSMINQLGFMVCGIGIGTSLAINGAVAHAFNDVLFKGLLFMSMGAVLHMTGKIRATDLGGLYKSMPVTTGLCIIGACSISAFPLFSGFVSKSLVMAAALQEGHHWVWLVLLFASAGVFHHAGIKIPFFAFFAQDSGIRTTEPPLNMLLAMALAAVLCVTIGLWPAMLYNLLPFPVDYSPYTVTHVLAQLQLLFFSALAFTWLKLSGLYPPEIRSVNIDVEWFYRWLGPRAVARMTRALDRWQVYTRIGFLRHLGTLFGTLFLYHGPQGILARTWATGSMVLWVVILLGLYLVAYYY